MRAMGLCIGLSLVGGAGGGTARAAAPVLTWTSASNVAAPTFSDLLASPLDGDIAELWIADNAGFIGPIDTTTIADTSANPVLFTGPTLADGNYWAEAFTIRGGVYSLPSNVVTFTIATFTLALIELPGLTLQSNSKFLIEFPGMTVSET